MGIKSFIAAAIVFNALVWAVVHYFITTSNYTHTLFGYEIDLPIAVWIVIPTVVLSIFVIIHLFFYGLLHHLKIGSYKKDYEKIMKKFSDMIMEKKPLSYHFSNEIFEEISKILDILKLPKGKIELLFKNKNVQNSIDARNMICDNKHADLRDFRLDKNNSLAKKNYLLMLKENKIDSLEMFNQYKDEDRFLMKEALYEYALKASWDEIKKIDFAIDRRLFKIFMSRLAEESDKFDMDIEDIIKFISQLEFSKDEFISLAKHLELKLNPEGLVLLFERLYEEFANASEAYLYLLFKYEMIDKIEHILQESDDKALDKFRFLLFLKQNGQNFDIGIFV